jgi:hypothetical protein
VPGHRRHAARITDRDRRLLAFAAEHRFVLAVHVAALLRTSPEAARDRLHKLAGAQLMRSERRLAGPAAHQITGRGLDAIGSPLPPPREPDLATYDHEVGLAWLWLAAERGRFGALRGLVSERQMRSADGRAVAPEERFGVRLPGAGPRGGERRHYPDLLLETASGHRVAIELELTRKALRRRREILGGYAIDARVDAVLYLVETRRMARAVQHAAAAAGVSSLVHVAPVRFAAGAGATGAGRSGERAGGRLRSDSRAQVGTGSATRQARGSARSAPDRELAR